MAVPTLDSATFLVAYCSQCDDEVLTYLDLDETLVGELQHRCLSCASPAIERFRELESDDLEEIGYEVVDARTCGNGGGCGAGGCATGTRN